MNEQRVEVVACGAEEMWLDRCGGCFEAFPDEIACKAHESTCVAMRDYLIDQKLHAQALDDGREDDAREIEESRLW